MNHLKSHAYIPESDGLIEEDDLQSLEEYSESEKVKKKKLVGRKKRREIKDEYITYDGNDFH